MGRDRDFPIWYQLCSSTRVAQTRARCGHWILKPESEKRRMHSTDTDEVISADDIRLHWQEIARSEVTRQRRRLAQLSDEQRVAVESALVSVADHMFEIVVRGAENCPGVDRFKYFNVWRRDSAAA